MLRHRVRACFVIFQTDESPRRAVSPLSTAPQLPPSLACEEHPVEELQGPARAREDEVLNSYGWEDQKAGLVHIPIDKAIEMLACQRGRPQSGRSTCAAKHA